MTPTYSNLISIGNLFQAWGEFKNSKRNKRDVQLFERHLEDNLFDLYFALKSKSYKHGRYFEFYVNDPKRRHIHKAEVADRVVHHLLYKHLYAIFDKTFIYDSYSCRLTKGTHRAVKRLAKFARIVSKNHTRDIWALKLDIKKFFASVDHDILLDLIKRKVQDRNVLWLIGEVIDSFYMCHSRLDRESDPRLRGDDNKVKGADDNHNCVGIPLGNLTSQIFANIYLNQLDQFIKHKLNIKYYLRYADDFLMVDNNKQFLLHCFETVKSFLKDYLKLENHPNKIFLRKLAWGIDFCGYIILPHYRLLRTRTQKRITKRISKGKVSQQSLQSYLGHCSHANAYAFGQDLKNFFWLSQLSLRII